MNTHKHQYAFICAMSWAYKEDETIRPDARSHGNFLHRIFERVFKDSSDQSFDQRLSESDSRNQPEASSNNCMEKVERPGVYSQLAS